MGVFFLSGLELVGGELGLLLGLFAENGEEVVLAQDHVLFAVELHFGPRVLAEEDAIALLHVERAELAVLERLAVADGDDETLDRLLLRGVRDDDPPLGLLFFLGALHDDAVCERTNLHLDAPLERDPTWAGRSLGTLGWR